MKPALMGSVFDSCRVVEQTADRISVHPEAGTPLGGVLRKRIVPGFPYSIIYRVWEVTSTSLPSLTNIVVRAISATGPAVANHRLEEALRAPQA
jgi:hypothetical protein